MWVSLSFTKKPVSEGIFLKVFKNGNLNGYVQCDIEETENLRENCGHFLSILVNNDKGRVFTGPNMNQ